MVLVPSLKYVLVVCIVISRWQPAVSNGPNRVGAPVILPDNGNRSSFQNVVFLGHQTMDKVKKPINPKYITPFPVFFRIDLSFNDFCTGSLLLCII
jgi:hypothetical protein